MDKIFQVTYSVEKTIAIEAESETHVRKELEQKLILHEDANPSTLKIIDIEEEE